MVLAAAWPGGETPEMARRPLIVAPIDGIVGRGTHYSSRGKLALGM